MSVVSKYNRIAKIYDQIESPIELLYRKWRKEALNPVSNIKRRKIPGGPAPEEMRSYLSKRQTELELNKQEIVTLKDMIDSAVEDLLATVDEYRKA